MNEWTMLTITDLRPKVVKYYINLAGLESGRSKWSGLLAVPDTPLWPGLSAH